MRKRRVVHGTPAEKFARRLAGVEMTATGCIEWPDARNGSGYGQVWDSSRRKIVYAHRLSWELANRRPIPAGLFVLHSCDNPPCCNPEHLRIGTPSDNHQDSLSRNRRAHVRHPRGEEHGMARLTEEQVIIARRRWRAGDPLAKIAADAGVSESTAHTAIMGKGWRHVDAEPPCEMGAPRPLIRSVLPINHGTDGGYSTHLNRGETACDACKRAHADAVRRRSRARRALLESEDR